MSLFPVPAIYSNVPAYTTHHTSRSLIYFTCPCISFTYHSPVLATVPMSLYILHISLSGRCCISHFPMRVTFFIFPYLLLSHFPIQPMFLISPYQPHLSFSPTRCISSFAMSARLPISPHFILFPFPISTTLLPSPALLYLRTIHTPYRPRNL